MNKPLRATLFWSLLVIFLILAPLLVLYTFGFRYNFQTGRVEHTGIVSISTIPKNALVEIDGKERRGATPTVVKQLRPRDTHVRIFKETFHAWEKTVSVLEQETLFLHDVVLWKEALPVLQASRGDLHLVDPTRTTLASLEASGAWTEAWTEELRSSNRTLIARFPGSDAEQISLQWSPDGIYLLLSQEGGTTLVSKRDGSEQLTLDDILPLGTQGLWWDEGQPHQLLLSTSTQTLGLEIDNGETTPLLSRPVQTLLSTNEELYYTRPAGAQTHVVSQTSDTEEVIGILPRGTYQFVSSRMPFLLLFDEDRERILLLDAGEHDQPILLHTEASEAHWSPKEDVLLYTNGFETHVFDPQTLQNLLIDRVSQPISSLAWHPAGTAAVLAHPGGIVAYDLHQPGSFVQTQLNNAREASRVFVDEKGETLFFLGTADNTYGFYRQALR